MNFRRRTFVSLFKKSARRLAPASIVVDSIATASYRKLTLPSSGCNNSTVFLVVTPRACPPVGFQEHS